MLKFLRFLAFLLVFPCLSHAQDLVNPFYDIESNEIGTFAITVAENQQIPSEINVKNRVGSWYIVSSRREALLKAMENGIIASIYLEPKIGPSLLNDSTRVTHFVNQVHSGDSLDFPFTGQGVIMGYVDDGLDVNNPDFENPDGTTRVLRFWNQGQSVNFRTPAKYGYGRVYTDVDINASVNPGGINGSSHGTSVAGAGSGDGSNSGTNKGVAPDCNIIVVRTSFALPNWTLTVAEGVDYVFSVADSLGMPVVVNLSVGTYLGSHDAKDPAGLYIDSLLNQQAGRIVVCAAGNSGAWPAYHVQQDLGIDTNFVWLEPNPALAYGDPGIYFDLWSDTTDIESMHFAFGADAPGPIYRGNTDFHQVDFSNLALIEDTIFGINGDVIGLVFFQGQVVGPNYNLQALVFTDSIDYKIRFLATGDGSIDLWSSANIGGSNFSTSIPDTVLYPDFTKYMMPDTLQSIVSSWACSDQVITVGNIHNRFEYTDFGGNTYPVGGGTTPSGMLSVNSSKGPNRNGLVKPDITATGDMSLSSRVTSISYPNDLLDETGKHIRNGGTSMASPVVAGIAALYLEKCPQASWDDFRTDLLNNAFQDTFSGNSLPNFAYGYGKAHALNTLKAKEFSPEILGSVWYCPDESELTVSGLGFENVIWNTEDTVLVLPLDSAGIYHGLAIHELGCKNYTDTIEVVEDDVSPVVTPPVDVNLDCLSAIPSPDPALVVDFSDNCSVEEVLFFDDSLHTDSCVVFLERTYRVTDASGNFTDVAHKFYFLDGIDATALTNDSVQILQHGCAGVFFNPDTCSQKLLSVDENGNTVDFDLMDVTIYNQFVSPLPMGVSTVNNVNTGYYEINDGANTFRISKRMFTVESPETFPINDGVLVRFYFNPGDFTNIVGDAPPAGVISDLGWYKSSLHDPDQIVGEMSASAPLLQSAEIVFPSASGVEDGLNFVEFEVESFSTFGFFASTIAGPLPIELSYLNATCSRDEIQVKWTTQSESESDYFTIELSRDGQEWIEKGNVQSEGNSNVEKTYFVEIPNPGFFQYARLCQFDLNGEKTIYPPIQLDCDFEQWQMEVFPVPTDDELNLMLQVPKSLEVKITIVGLDGKVLKEYHFLIEKGISLIPLDFRAVSKGVYLILVSAEGQTDFIEKVVKP